MSTTLYPEGSYWSLEARSAMQAGRCGGGLEPGCTTSMFQLRDILG